MMAKPFRDRREAGRRLAERALLYAHDNPIVLALPRGGVPVAFEVASALAAPLDVCVVRKLGVPGNEELAMGAIASGGGVAINNDVLKQLRLSSDVVEKVARREFEELRRRENAYRGERPALTVADRTVLLVDDGLATGATMRAAVSALRSSGPRKLVVAVPVAAPQACRDLKESADDVLCAVIPDHFRAVGDAYVDFSQTTDGEVRWLLQTHRKQLLSEPMSHRSLR
jgi:putative phosphoribosyl transferase